APMAFRYANASSVTTLRNGEPVPISAERNKNGSQFRDANGSGPTRGDSMENFEAPDNRQFVTALARGLELLRCFRPDSAELSNQLLARRSGLPRPTVSRLTYTLRTLGYLDYDPDSGKYRLGPGVLALG